MESTRSAFGDALAALGDVRPDVVVLDGEVSDSTRTAPFARAHPERFFECYTAEQQMLAAARALMARPRVLLMDEPSMGLAPMLVEQVFETIERINAQGVTILLVEQNAPMALGIADHGYVLESGKIVLDGPGRDLLDDERVIRAYLG